MCVFLLLLLFINIFLVFFFSNRESTKDILIGFFENATILVRIVIVKGSSCFIGRLLNLMCIDSKEKNKNYYSDIRT